MLYQNQSNEVLNLFNEAVRSATDYSAKVIAQQAAFARKVSEKNSNLSPKELTAFPADTARITETVSEYADFALETVKNFEQVANANLNLWERAVTFSVESAQNAFSIQSNPYSEKVIEGVKSAKSIAKDNISVSCQATIDGIKNIPAKATDSKANGKANGKK